MATNLYPFSHNLDGADKPLIIMGLVQAGSSQAIKAGELCVYNETASNWVPVDAVADYKYSLAFAAEEQKASDLARYMQFYAIREHDVWEMALAAARSCVYGDALTLTASDSQKLTYDADGFPVATYIGRGNYPEVGTTIGSLSYAQVIFNPEVSYLYRWVKLRPTSRVYDLTSATTLTAEHNGAIITNKSASGSVTVTAPAAIFSGFSFKMAVMSNNAFVFDPKPDTSKLYIKGAANTAGATSSMTDIGDFAEYVFDGTDWLAINSISGADDDITIA